MPGLHTGSLRATRRSKKVRAGRVMLAALGSVALVFGGATMPASATPAATPPQEEVLDFLEVAPATAGLAAAPAEVDMTVTGLPETTEAGAPIAINFEVQNSLLGVDAPTGEVALVAVTGGIEGFELLGTEPLAAGQTELIVRPMGLGVQTLVAVYLGDAAHMPLVQLLDPLSVTPVSTVVNIDIDSNSPAYGGGSLGVWVSALSVCENEAPDPDVAELCQATHGDPDGDVTLLMDGVPLGTQPIQGSNQLGVPAWLDLSTDLGNPDARSTVRFDVDVPDRALGTPEHYSFTAEFTPHNWFTAATSGSTNVATQPGETVTEVMLGNLEQQIRKVKVGELVEVSAFAWAEPSWSAPLDGVVNLWVNGELAAEGIEFGGEFPSATAKISLDEAGAYELVAEFVPRSLNHTGSKSPAYTFTVEAAAPDGGSDAGSNGGSNAGSDANGSSNGGNDGGSGGSNASGADTSPKPAQPKGQLAHTGADGTSGILGLGALLVAGAGIVLVAVQRRRARSGQA